MHSVDEIEIYYLIFLSIISLIILLVLIFLKRKPSEIITSVFSLFLIAIISYIPNLSDFSLNKSGFEAKMKDRINQANASIEQMRNIAVTITRSTMGTIALSELESGDKLEAVEAGSEMVKELKALGVNDISIEFAMQEYNNWIELSLLRNIERIYKEDCLKINLLHKCDNSIEKFETKPISKAEDIKTYVSENISIGETLQKAIYELNYYQINHKINDLEYFKNTPRF